MGFSLFLLPYLCPLLFLPLSALSLSLPSSSSLPPSLPPTGVRTVATCVSLSISLSLSAGILCACLLSNCYSQHSDITFRCSVRLVPFSTTRYPTTNERACVRARTYVCVRMCVRTGDTQHATPEGGKILRTACTRSAICAIADSRVPRED